jgi:integrase
VRAAELVRAYVNGADQVEREREERRTRGIMFRELAADYLVWLERVRGAKPSTLRQHRSDLAEPGIERPRFGGVTTGYIMRAIGEVPAANVTVEDIEALLQAYADTGVAPRSVNRVRNVVSAVFNYGIKVHKLSGNPAAGADKRREPEAAVLDYYRPDEIEAIARAMGDGQDAETVRIAAYAGLRLGELLALKWKDVDWAGSKLTIVRSMSAGVETSTKSGKARTVGLADQAAAALARLANRRDFTEPDDLVFCNDFGRTIDGSALRRRYKAARDTAGLRPLKWHDLRHTFGSLLVAGGMDIVSVQALLGHSKIETTSRYLHARPATELAAKMTAIFGSGAAGSADEPQGSWFGSRVAQPLHRTYSG